MDMDEIMDLEYHKLLEQSKSEGISLDNRNSLGTESMCTEIEKSDPLQGLVQMFAKKSVRELDLNDTQVLNKFVELLCINNSKMNGVIDDVNGHSSCSSECSSEEYESLDEENIETREDDYDLQEEIQSCRASKVLNTRNLIKKLSQNLVASTLPNFLASKAMF